MDSFYAYFVDAAELLGSSSFLVANPISNTAKTQSADNSVFFLLTF